MKISNIGSTILLRQRLQRFSIFCEKDELQKLFYIEKRLNITMEKKSRRKRGQDVDWFSGVKKDTALGRVYNVHQTQTECYYLRILLQHVRGPTSFEDLRNVNGIILQTYQGACKRLGLLEGDQRWENTLGNDVAGIFILKKDYYGPKQVSFAWFSGKTKFKTLNPKITSDCNVCPQPRPRDRAV